MGNAPGKNQGLIIHRMGFFSQLLTGVKLYALLKLLQKSAISEKLSYPGDSASVVVLLKVTDTPP